MSIPENLGSGHEMPVVAAMDLGSNSFHLIIARIVEGTLQPISKQKVAVQLASGLDDKMRISDEAIARGLDALRSFAFALSGFKQKSVRIIATYTLRKAINARDFLTAAQEFLDYPIEIVSGEEEARLIYDGVAHTQGADSQRLVLDIGGGSTELIVGTDFDPVLVRSINMGCVTFSREHFAHGEITRANFLRAYDSARERLSLCHDAFHTLNWHTAIGCSGTIKAVYALCQRDSQCQYISREQLNKIADELIQHGDVNQLDDLNLSPDRCRTISAGVAILLALFDEFEITKLNVSDAALREGVLYSLDARLQQIDVRKRSIDGIAKRYYVDHQQANRVKATALSLFDAVNSTQQNQQHVNAAKLLLSSAALVHEIGLHIHTRGYHNHSAYIVAHSDLPGFNQQQINTLTKLLKNCRKRLDPELISPSTDTPALLIMCIVLRLAIIVNQKRQDDFLPPLNLSLEQQQVRLTLPEGWLDDKAVIAAALARESEYLKRENLQLVIVYTDSSLKF